MVKAARLQKKPEFAVDCQWSSGCEGSGCAGRKRGLQGRPNRKQRWLRRSMTSTRLALWRDRCDLLDGKAAKNKKPARGGLIDRHKAILLEALVAGVGFEPTTFGL
jgi:hypothetical protein